MYRCVPACSILVSDLDLDFGSTSFGFRLRSCFAIKDGFQFEVILTPKRSKRSEKGENPPAWSKRAHARISATSKRFALRG